MQISGDGLYVDATATHPAGRLYSGGYDSQSNVLFLAGVLGHPRGVSLAGGDPSSPNVSGLRVLIVDGGDVFWTTDSMSLPRGLTAREADTVQIAMQNHFTGRVVHRVDKLEDVPR